MLSPIPSFLISDSIFLLGGNIIKKVLCGLVIALTMTGSGYADNMISQGTKTCPKLFNQLLVLSAEFE